MEPIRTLPLRIALGDGESLHSWLLRLAYRNGMALLHLAAILGFGDRLRVPHNYALSWRLPPDLLRRMEIQTGLAHGALDRAVLDQFDPLGWKPVPGSRYCTGCLTESGGIWQTRWQLPYTFACLRHRALLASVCPQCHRPPPSAALSLRAGLLPTTQCVHGTQRQTLACQADLLTHPPQPLPARDSRLRAQRWIDQRLGLHDANAIAELRDLDALSIWFRQRIEPSELAAYGPATVAAMIEYRDNNHGQKREKASATIIAAALSTQAIALISADERHFRRLLAPLLRDVYSQYRAGQTPSKNGPKMLSHKRVSGLSEPLQHKVLLSAGPHLPVSEQLRYYTCTQHPRLTQPASTIAADRARHIPQYLWHDWLVRFLPRKGAHVDAIATDLPIALLIPGNPTRNINATDELNPWRNNVSIALGELSRRWPDILPAICCLADHLDTVGSPIDYRRRRDTFLDVELTPRVWDHYCELADAHPGTGLRRLQARRYMFQLLTGADLSNRAHLLTFRDDGGQDQHGYISHFQRTLETKLRQELHQHAANLLADAGIDEPLTWSPPPQCVAGLTLPGREPDDINTSLLHQLIIVEQHAFSIAAKQLAVSTEHARYATRLLHQGAKQHAKNTPPASRKVHQRAEETLDRAFFEHEHVQARKSLAAMAAETGFSTKVIAQYAKLAGIPINQSRKFADIDPDWLQEQAGTRFRTNDDIASELGLRGETVRRYRSNYGIPGRSTGPEGHVVTNLLHPDLPADIRRAVEGQRNGWQRLQRFQQMTAYPSMNSAAKALGLHTQNLNLQIQRLETDIGAPILQRAPHRYAPMVPTRRGQRLLDHLAQPQIRRLLNQYADANARPKCGPYKTKPGPVPRS